MVVWKTGLWSRSTVEQKRIEGGSLHETEISDLIDQPHIQERYQRIVGAVSWGNPCSMGISGPLSLLRYRQVIHCIV